MSLLAFDVSRSFYFRIQSMFACIGAVADLKNIGNSMAASCSQFNGADLLNAIRQSRQQRHVNRSSVITYNYAPPFKKDKNWRAYVLQNAVMYSTHASTCVSIDKSNLPDRGDDHVARFIKQSASTAECPQHCAEKKTLIVVDTADFWNWWWVLVISTSHYNASVGSGRFFIGRHKHTTSCRRWKRKTRRKNAISQYLSRFVQSSEQ